MSKNNLVVIKQQEDGRKLVIIEDINVVIEHKSFRKQLKKELFYTTGLFSNKKPRKQRRILRRKNNKNVI